MTRCLIVCFTVIILRSCKSYSELCPKTILNTPQGRIEARGDDGLCRIWTIHPPDNFITTLRLTHFMVDSCINVYFEIRNTETNYSACIKTNKPKLLPAFRKPPIHITISTATQSSIVLDFFSRSNTICPNKDFECTDKSNCFDYQQICDGTFDCADHSDEMCEVCPKDLVSCSINTTKCFNPKKERCDGYYNCLSAEDEFNCTLTCTNAIKCQNTKECFQPHQRCDKVQQCSDGSDERNCPRTCDRHSYYLCADGRCIGKEFVGDGKDDCQDGSDEKSKHMAIKIIILLALIVLTCIATALVHRWCNSRRNINHLIRNPPEFPLPPFRGPGEYSGYQLQFSECDYQHGGEIYEAFVQSRRENQERLRAYKRMNNYNIHNVTPRSSIGALNDSTVAALASLGIPKEFCIGLDNSRKQMTPDSRASTEETDSLRCVSSNWGRTTNGDVAIVNGKTCVLSMFE